MISTRRRYALWVMLEMAKLQERRNLAVEYFHSGIFFKHFWQRNHRNSSKKKCRTPEQKNAEIP